MIKLSIVVPVYNVEPYIKKCIQSLVNQNVPKNEYEIIIVDDGSPDNSIKIVEESFSEPNIRIVRKQNGGLSSARNAGFAVAQGEYVWFVDSDDWIEDNCLKDLFKFMDGNVRTIAMSRFIPEGDWSDSFYNKTDETVETGLQLCAGPHLTAAQFYICNSEFLRENKLSFYEGILHEDSEYTPRMLYLAGDITLLTSPVYHYLKRGNSITTVIKPKRCYDYMLVCRNLIAFYNETVVEADKSAFSNIISNAILELLKLSLKVEVGCKNDIHHFVNEEINSSQYFISSYRLFTRILGNICKLTHIPVATVYNALAKIRY